MSYENRFLQQIFMMKDSLNNAHFEMLENIFNIYDYDGDGNLNDEEYISFMSDIMYISVLMKRIKDSEYTMDNVNKIATWSRSNFKSNLFREPLPVVSHDLFLEEILYALTENQAVPLHGSGFSLVPELIQYFNYYVDVAKRRGWPTELARDDDAIVNTLEPRFHLPICITNVNTYNEYKRTLHTRLEDLMAQVEAQEQAKEQTLVQAQEPVQEPVQVLTPAQQLNDYQERRRRKYREEQEAKEREKKEKEDEIQRIADARIQEQERTNAILRERQRTIEAEQSAIEAEQPVVEAENIRMEREQALIYIDPADNSRMRELEDTLQQLERVQQALRDRTRQQGYDLGIDQIDDQTFVKLIEHIGEIPFSQEQDGYDPVDGNVNVITFLEEEPADRIAFKCGESYYLASRERIKNMINLENSENALFYGCVCELQGDWTLIETWALLEPTVISNPVYYNIQQLGLPIRYVYLDDVKQVLESNYRFFSVERPEDFQIIPSFASDNILNHGIGSTSGSHCQDGQADGVYRIKSFDTVIL
jgi:hypothetical protein